MKAKLERVKMKLRTWHTQKYERTVEVIHDSRRGFVFKLHGTPFSVEKDQCNSMGVGSLWNIYCKGTLIATAYFGGVYEIDDIGILSSTDAIPAEMDWNAGVENSFEGILEAVILRIKETVDRDKVTQTKGDKLDYMTFKEAVQQLNRTAEFEGQIYEI